MLFAYVRPEHKVIRSTGLINLATLEGLFAYTEQTPKQEAKLYEKIDPKSEPLCPKPDRLRFIDER
ncbi:hypothetical protein N7457_004544 [Penicillium paradoxum]|uniref:uncharacterized protein n=1 Tax=Penicillium paradoxum TaxID=176176 RepID=UPI00254953AC|nr:uncharacterized protein N7457_004544 [Penicillium paradoxum]KAJ5782770.1 hypothetical protein N7457_004544 [Penicillium paradoxum]